MQSAASAARPLTCELCKSVYPTYIHTNSAGLSDRPGCLRLQLIHPWSTEGQERSPLVEVPFTQPPFIVLENMVGRQDLQSGVSPQAKRGSEACQVRDSQQHTSRGLHVISLAEKARNLPLKLQIFFHPPRAGSRSLLGGAQAWPRPRERCAHCGCLDLRTLQKWPESSLHQRGCGKLQVSISRTHATIRFSRDLSTFVEAWNSGPMSKRSSDVSDMCQSLWSLRQGPLPLARQLVEVRHTGRHEKTPGAGARLCEMRGLGLWRLWGGA